VIKAKIRLLLVIRNDLGTMPIAAIGAVSTIVQFCH
jgi:hypothetical protein